MSVKLAEKTLEASEWIGGGGLKTLRSALPDKDPQSWPSLWREKYNEDLPGWAREQMGMPPKICPECGRSD